MLDVVACDHDTLLLDYHGIIDVLQKHSTSTDVEKIR